MTEQDSMQTVIGISGALCRGSIHAALLRGAVERAPAGLTIEVASSRGIARVGAARSEEGTR